MSATSLMTTLIAATAMLATPAALAQEPPADIKSRIGPQGETCLCNEDYTSCLCCETVATPPFIACDIVADGKEVTGPASVDLRLKTGKRGQVAVERFKVKQ